MADPKVIACTMNGMEQISPAINPPPGLLCPRKNMYIEKKKKRGTNALIATSIIMVFILRSFVSYNFTSYLRGALFTIFHQRINTDHCDDQHRYFSERIKCSKVNQNHIYDIISMPQRTRLLYEISLKGRV